MRARRSANICFGASETGSMAEFGLNSPFKFEATLEISMFPGFLLKRRLENIPAGAKHADWGRS